MYDDMAHPSTYHRIGCAFLRFDMNSSANLDDDGASSSFGEAAFWAFGRSMSRRSK